MQNKRLLELVGTERRKKVIRYRMPDDRKRSLAAGLIIRKILNENGLSEDSLKYSENGKPLADNLFFNISHAGDYVVGVSSDREVGCDIEKIVDAPLEVTDRFFHLKEAEYIKSAEDKNRAFFTLWTLKESYMKMTGKGFSIPPEMIGFTLDEKGKIQSEKEGVFRQYLLAEGVISVCIKENAETADYFKVRKVEWES